MTNQRDTGLPPKEATLFKSIVTNLTEVVHSGVLGSNIASFGTFATKSISLNAAAFVAPTSPRITKRSSSAIAGGANQVSLGG